MLMDLASVIVFVRDLAFVGDTVLVGETVPVRCCVKEDDSVSVSVGDSVGVSVSVAVGLGVVDFVVLRGDVKVMLSVSLRVGENDAESLPVSVSD
jgi:hypothetical protein